MPPSPEQAAQVSGRACAAAHTCRSSRNTDLRSPTVMKPSIASSSEHKIPPSIPHRSRKSSPTMASLRLILLPRSLTAASTTPYRTHIASLPRENPRTASLLPYSTSKRPLRGLSPRRQSIVRRPLRNPRHRAGLYRLTWRPRARSRNSRSSLHRGIPSHSIIYTARISAHYA